MVTKEQMNEFTQSIFKKDFGRVSKYDYCLLLMLYHNELYKIFLEKADDSKPLNTESDSKE